ncbi:MAG: glycosyltransferase [Crocinitomicaceae bacterium]
MKNFINSVYSDFNKISKKVDWFICASNAVKNDLFENWNIKNSNVIYELSKFETKESKTNIENTIIISGSGRGAHRKGLDLFIKTSQNILLNSNNAKKYKFQWLGYLTDDEKKLHKQLVSENNLESYFTFLEEREDTSSFFAETDIFVMSSREDPFPLVCIEAANYGIPIFLFNKATERVRKFLKI